MKINLKQTIKGYDGKELKDEKGTATPLRDILSTALNSPLKDEILTAEQKNKIFQISLKLYSSNEADLTIDDRAFIKEKVGKIWPSLVYGRVCEILEGQKNEEVKDGS